LGLLELVVVVELVEQPLLVVTLVLLGPAVVKQMILHLGLSLLGKLASLEDQAVALGEHLELGPARIVALEECLD
jgi:hypothetical protein